MDSKKIKSELDERLHVILVSYLGSEYNNPGETNGDEMRKELVDEFFIFCKNIKK